MGSLNHRVVPRLAAAASAAVLSLTAAAGASAATPTIYREINNHVVTTQHGDAVPGCPGSVGITEIATGNEHMVVVDQEDTVHVTYGETFHIVAIPDDPSIPSSTRQGTDALVFNIPKDGTEIFHESFHDFGPAAWDPFAKIQLFVTFVYRDGEVIVDHQFGRDLPPEGC